MNNNLLRLLAVPVVCCTITGCHATRFVGTACAEEGCALREDGEACIASELQYDLSIRDLPGLHPEIAFCTGRQLTKNDGGLVQCRMLWSYTSAEVRESTVRHLCADQDFLTQAPASEVFDDDAEPDQHCLVRQITEAQAKSGKAGWYYLASAPTHCPNVGPGVMIPSQRPDETDWQVQLKLQCATSVTLEDDGSVAEVDPAECAVPRADATGVGQPCSGRIFLSSDFPTVDLGAADCQTGVCVTVPHPGQGDVCPVDDLTSCSLRGPRCSCRCAGAPGDPGPFCACPDDYECKPMLSDFAAPPAIRGSYCVPADSPP